MIRKKMLCALMLLCFLLPVAGFAEAEGEKVAKASGSQVKINISSLTAQDFVREKKKCETRTADFTRLRYAYTKTSDYDPYKTRDSLADSMFEAYEGKDYKKTISLANQILQTNFVNIDAHRLSELANEKLGDKQKASFHSYMVHGLITSIMKSGPGVSPENAMIVICVPEEYVFLRCLGLKSTGQSLLHVDGHNIDKMDTIDPKTGKKLTFYFNVDIPFNHLTDKLMKSMKEKE